MIARIYFEIQRINPSKPGSRNLKKRKLSSYKVKGCRLSHYKLNNYLVLKAIFHH